MFISRTLTALLVLPILVLLAPQTVGAQASAKYDAPSPVATPAKNSAYESGPYLKNLPTNGPIKIVVFGDSLGRGLVEGMRWAFGSNRSVKIINGTRPGTGLARNDIYNWPNRVRRALKRHNPHLVVVLIGGNDRQDMRIGRKRLRRFTAPWFLEYRQRVQTVMGILHKAQVPTYWVSLPNVRSPRMTRDFTWFNELYRLETIRHGFVFIDDLGKFSNDGKRKYARRGKGLSGKRRMLRQRDGMHFTLYGNRLLAAIVGRPIQKDIEKARRLNSSEQTEGLIAPTSGNEKE